MTNISRLIASTPCMENMGGHHFAYFSSLARALDALNWKYTFYIAKSATFNQWTPYFRKCKSRILTGCFQIFDSFTLIRKERQKKDVLFFESFTVFNLVGMFLGFLFFHVKGRRVLIFHRSTLHDRFIFKTIVNVCSRLNARCLKDDLIPVTDSELIAKVIQPLFRSQVKILPIPHTFAPAKNPKNRETINLWLPGVVGGGKGLSFINKLLKQVSPLAKKCHFFIGEDAAGQIPDKNAEIKVSFLPRHLSSAKYQDKMLSSDWILLPYDPWIYRDRTSGVMIEAIASGKIVFVRDGSWLASELKKFDLEALILNWDSPNLLSIMYEQAKNPDVQAKLQKMKEYYHATHSVPNFTKTLKEIIS